MFSLLSETAATGESSYSSEFFKVYTKGHDTIRGSGVGLVVHPYFVQFIKSITFISDRIVHITVNSRTHPMHFVGVYIPHSGEQHDSIRPKVWNELSAFIATLAPSSFIIIAGDFNTRLRLRRPEEHDFIGPHLHHPHSAPLDENRNHAIELCATHSLCFANTYRPTKTSQQITYTEKPPPHLGTIHYHKTTPPSTTASSGNDGYHHAST